MELWENGWSHTGAMAFSEQPLCRGEHDKQEPPADSAWAMPNSPLQQAPNWQWCPDRWGYQHWCSQHRPRTWIPGVRIMREKRQHGSLYESHLGRWEMADATPRQEAHVKSLDTDSQHHRGRIWAPGVSRVCRGRASFVTYFHLNFTCSPASLQKYKLYWKRGLHK